MKAIFLQKTREKRGQNSKSQCYENDITKQANIEISRDLFKDFDLDTTHKAISYEERVQKDTINPQKIFKGNHTSYQLMQLLITGANCHESSCILSTQEQQEELGELLTNRFKIQNYKFQLKKEIKQGNKKQTKHMKLLLVLLQQIGKCDIEVKYCQQGLSIGFNNKTVNKLQEQIDLLLYQNQKRKKQMQELTKEYDKIVYQFNQVIEKLIQKQEKHKGFY